MLMSYLEMFKTATDQEGSYTNLKKTPTNSTIENKLPKDWKLTQLQVLLFPSHWQMEKLTAIHISWNPENRCR